MLKTILFDIFFDLHYSRKRLEQASPSYQMLPLRARVYQGAMAMKGYSAFPIAPALLEPHYEIV